MFPSKEGNITCHDNVMKRHYEPALRKAGLRHVTFHSLRHTNASLRIHAEQNIKYMSTQMGHSSIKVTLDVYGHLFNDEEFNRQQVDLLQTSFQSVRNPLEKPLPETEKGARLASNPL
jgi:integrase